MREKEASGNNLGRDNGEITERKAGSGEERERGCGGGEAKMEASRARKGGG